MNVVGALAAAGVVALASGACARLVALAILRSSRDDEAFADLVGTTKFAVPVFGIVASVVLSLPFELVQGVLEISGSFVVATVVTGFYIFAVALVVTAAWSRGLEPLVSALVPKEIAPPDWQRRRWRLLGSATLATVSVLFVVGLLLDRVPYDLVLVLGVVLYLGVYWPLAMPGRVVTGVSPYQSRPPTEAQRARIERCFERLGRSPGRILIRPASADRAVVVVGRGDGKTVAVADQFLERVDDEALAVSLAQADERERRGYMRNVAWMLTLAVVDVVIVVFWLDGGLTLPYLGAAIGVTLLAIVFGPFRWNATATVAADRFAADQFGAETVVQVYQNVGDDLSWISDPFWSSTPTVPGVRREPEMDERIERLEAGFEGERAASGTSEDPPPAGEPSGTGTGRGENGPEHAPPPEESGKTHASDAQPTDDAVQWPATRRRVLAASALLVVGLVLALAVPYVVGDLQDYAGDPTVERFDPAEQPGAADADPAVVDLDDRVANGSADFREAIETAATTGEYEATDEAVPDELHWLADDDRFPTPEYVVYDGRYYEWYGYAGSVRPSVTVELDELAIGEAMDELATPYADATTGTREQIDGEGGRWGVAGVVVRNGTYYAVSSPFWDRVGQSPTGFTRQILGAAASALLLPVGVAFAVVGAWLLGRLWRRRSTAIDRTSAATLGVVAAVIGGGLALGGSSWQFVGHHATMAAGLVGLVVAGDRIRRGRWLPVGAIALGVPVVVVVASVATGWVFGLILGPPGLMAAGITGWPLLCYGYLLGREPTGNATAAPDSENCRGT